MERTLWALLRNRALGFKFRRQHPIGPFFVDFFCRDAALVIEVDGPYHRYQRDADRLREGWLKTAGLRVLRLTNDEVLQHPQRVLHRISHYLGAEILSPHERGLVQTPSVSVPKHRPCEARSFRPQTPLPSGEGQG